MFGISSTRRLRLLKLGWILGQSEFLYNDFQDAVIQSKREQNFRIIREIGQIEEIHFQEGWLSTYESLTTTIYDHFSIRDALCFGLVAIGHAAFRSTMSDALRVRGENPAPYITSTLENLSSSDFTFKDELRDILTSKPITTIAELDNLILSLAGSSGSTDTPNTQVFSRTPERFVLVFPKHWERAKFLADLMETRFILRCTDEFTEACGTNVLECYLIQRRHGALSKIYIFSPNTDSIRFFRVLLRLHQAMQASPSSLRLLLIGSYGAFTGEIGKAVGVKYAYKYDYGIVQDDWVFSPNPTPLPAEARDSTYSESVYSGSYLCESSAKFRKEGMAGVDMETYEFFAFAEEMNYVCMGAVRIMSDDPDSMNPRVDRALVKFAAAIPFVEDILSRHFPGIPQVPFGGSMPDIITNTLRSGEVFEKLNVHSVDVGQSLSNVKSEVCRILVAKVLKSIVSHSRDEAIALFEQHYAGFIRSTGVYGNVHYD